MNKVEKAIHAAGLSIYCATSGRLAYHWPTKYGRPFGGWLMAQMVRRSQRREERKP